MIRIVDYGIGNVLAIVNMFRSAGIQAEVTGDPDQLRSASRLILAGVGAFDAGMNNLRDRGLVPVLQEAVFERGIPVLGICLGMQLLMQGSDEGSATGLGWIEGRSVRIRGDGPVPVKVPHMGWNEVQPVRSSPLLRGLEHHGRFYFAHSFAVACANADDVVANAIHGAPFPAIVSHGRVSGVQFHPEKSHKYGRQLLTNFAQAELA
jgi:imidazole glycerol-phosphate synthase subunit HisH